MANLDRIINITTISATNRIDKNNFNVLLHMTPHALTPERLIGVTTADQLLGLGFTRESTAYRVALTYFAQSPHARDLMIGRVAVSSVRYTLSNANTIAGAYGFDIKHRKKDESEYQTQNIRVTIPAEYTESITQEKRTQLEKDLQSQQKIINDNQKQIETLRKFNTDNANSSDANIKKQIADNQTKISELAQANTTAQQQITQINQQLQGTRRPAQADDVYKAIAQQVQGLPMTVDSNGGISFAVNDPDLVWSIKPFGRLVQNSATPSETYLEALAECNRENPYWYGVSSDANDESTVIGIAEWVEANHKLYGVTVGASAFDGSITTDLASKINERGFKRTIVATSPYDGEMVHVAMFSVGFSYYAGQESWANKRLTTVRASEILESQYNAATKKRANTYEKFNGGISLTQNGMTASGEWIDVVRFSDWLTQEIQTDVAYLFANAPKVPFTDAGIDMIVNAMMPALSLAIRRGGLAPEEVDANGNIVPSYRIEKPRSASISANNKASRKLTDLNVFVRLAGAIHQVEMQITLTYGLETQGA